MTERRGREVAYSAGNQCEKPVWTVVVSNRDSAIRGGPGRIEERRPIAGSFRKETILADRRLIAGSFREETIVMAGASRPREAAQDVDEEPVDEEPVGVLAPQVLASRVA
jgi:hypothetical protein